MICVVALACVSAYAQSSLDIFGGYSYLQSYLCILHETRLPTPPPGARRFHHR
jgi:hypothetical protein